MSVDHNNRDLGSAIVDRNSMIFAGKLKIPKNSILRPKKVPKTSRYKGGWQKIFFYYFSLCNFTPFQKFVGKTSKLGACCMRKTLIQGRFCMVPLTPWYKSMYIYTISVFRSVSRFWPQCKNTQMYVYIHTFRFFSQSHFWPCIKGLSIFIFLSSPLCFYSQLNRNAKYVKI